MPQENRGVLDLVINNARVFDGAALLDGLQSVGIAKGRISFVGSSTERALKEIDAAGKFLMPGLIDCHLHLLNMWTATDAATMEIDIREQLPARLMDFFRAGVTSIKSVGDSEDDILRVRGMIANGEIVGPRLFVTGAAFAAPGSHPATTIYGKNQWIRKRATVETDSPNGAREAIRRMADKKVDAIKIVHQGGCKHGEPYFFKVPALDMDVQILRLGREVMEAIIDEAHKHGLKVTVHTVDEEAAIEALSAGADGLEHGVVEERLRDDRVIELLLQNRASYVPTLWLIRFEERSAETRYANLRRVVDAGVKVVLGSDSFCGYGKFGENTLEEVERSAQAGIPAPQILRMATRNAAEHLGASDLGTIATGKFADMILVDGDPMTDVSALRHVSTVIKNGEVISA